MINNTQDGNKERNGIKSPILILSYQMHAGVARSPATPTHISQQMLSIIFSEYFHKDFEPLFSPENYPKSQAS